MYLKNRFYKGELVIVNGEGKIFGNVKNKLGLVIEKDEYYGDYNINVIFGKQDWYSVSNITRAFEREKQVKNKYQLKLCTTLEGYNLLKDVIKTINELKSDYLQSFKVFRNFKLDINEYIIIGWNNVYWNMQNKQIKSFEKRILDLKNKNIPFKYIIMNENKITDIRIENYSKLDKNVDIIYVERKIKIKGKKGEKYDSTKNIKYNDKN